MAKFLPGFSRFCVGVNYWASNAGVQMWSKFSAEEVENDFAALHDSGVNTVRIFPLWEDFQPVKRLAFYSNQFRELGFPDGSPLPAKGLKSFGIDPVMMDRFRTVADLAQKYDLQLVVSLLTGWMSGAMFVPPAIADRNLLEDFLALRIADMFIRGFVGAMKDHPAIVAWEPGNECNCLSPATPDSSWNWLNTIVSAIRLTDPSRPVYSGMHGTKVSALQPFSLMMQGGLCDAVTTHPYPSFTPCCGKSALNTIPAIFHATAETLFYRGASGKAAFVEEIGAFGHNYLSEKRTDDYLYTTLHSALVHDLGAVLWWCGFSFDRCADTTPYRWVAMERELGAMKSDRTPDGAGKAMKRFAAEYAKLPKFSSRQVDATVIILPHDEAWKAAYGAFILSKQAGFEIEFCHIASVDKLPESKVFIVPSITGYQVMDHNKYQLLLNAASNGAAVIFTADSGYLQPFARFFGCTVDYRTEKPETISFTLNGKTFFTDQKITRRMTAVDCDVLALDQDNTPAITCKNFGKGKLFFVNAALENNAADMKCDLYLVYRELARYADINVPEKSPEIGITRHKTEDGRTLKVFINYADHAADGMPANSVKYEFAD